MALRSLVSKKKKRFTDVTLGIDLDLSYITERIIAMGFPSEGGESAYRNPLWAVQRLFAARHAGHELVINLCSERSYPDSTFTRCLRFPFDDHTPPPLELIAEFCNAAQEWLRADPENIVAVHCKAGKGRTGVMVSALLIALGTCASASEALRMFGRERTHDGKGVTIPSQARYVHYWEQWQARKLPRELSLVTPTYKVTRARFITIPDFDVGITGCDPYLLVSISNGDLHNARCWDMRTHHKRLEHFKLKHGVVDLDFSKFSLFVRDNVRMTWMDRDTTHADEKMFALNFHTAFIDSGTHLCFEKSVLDGACKDKQQRFFNRAFVFELFVERVPASHVLATEAGYNACFSRPI